jgi:photosystem II stability/assembly factor-like uncharacterized protein
MLFVVMSISASAQGSWERIAMPTNRFIRTIAFTDSLTGWIGADSGLILHTTDGARSWVVQPTGTFADVAAIFFLNGQMGRASCHNFRNPPYGTELLSTTDGGMHWTLQNYPEENLFMTCIQYLDSLNGWMGGKPHALVRTHDGGATWIRAAIDTSTLAFFPVLTIRFYNERIGYAGGGMFDIAGVIWRTTDGGEHWAAMDPVYAPADEVHALHIFDSLHLLGAGGDPDFGYGVGLTRTADGGESWSYQELGFQGNAYDIAFRNDREVWAPLGPRQRMIVSMDGGSTWTERLTPDSTAIYRMIFTDSLHGYAVGRSGAFLRYHPAPVGMPSELDDVPAIFATLNNYPNPFSSETTILLTVSPRASRIGGAVRIIISDLSGREVATVFHGMVAPGINRIAFNSKDLAPGLYTCRMVPEGGGIPVVGKMVKVATP